MATPRDFNAEAATYDEKPLRVVLARDVAQAIRDAAPLNSESRAVVDALDFGCGTGLVALELQPFVRSLTGVDSAQGMLDVFKSKVEARKLPNVHTLLLDHASAALDALSGPFQLIYSSMTLHHVADIASLLGRLHRLAAPGGRLCLADLDAEGGRFHEHAHGVFHNGFNRAELAAALRDAGFDDIKDRNAATIAKPNAAGEMEQFTVFLMTARKNS